MTTTNNTARPALSMTAKLLLTAIVVTAATFSIVGLIVAPQAIISIWGLDAE